MLRTMAGPDWDQGLPADILAQVASGSEDMRAMLGVSTSWRAGFELSITRLTVKKEERQLLADADLDYFEEKPLVSLSLRGCHQLTSAGLERLRGKPLTRLDLGGCTLVTSLNVLSGMPLKNLCIRSV